MFLDNKIQTSFSEFDEALNELSNLYAYSSYADFVDSSKKLIKLIYHKRGNINHGEDQLIIKNTELVRKLKDRYRVFRILIKERFCI